MKLKPNKTLWLLALLAVWGCTSTNQISQNTAEYDDLYFSSQDREAAIVADASRRQAPAQSYKQTSNTSTNVTQEQASPSSNQGSPDIDFDNGNINSQYGETESDNINSSTYYDPNYRNNNDNFQNQSAYNTPSGGFNYNSGFNSFYNDPFYNPWFGSRTTWNVGVGIGSTWGNPYYHAGFNPYFGSPYYRPAVIYDPFIANSIYNPWLYGNFGPVYRPFGGGIFNSFYCPPFGFNNRNTVIVTNTNANGEATVRSRYYGPRFNRTSSTVVTNQSGNTRTRQARPNVSSGTKTNGQAQVTTPGRTRTRTRTNPNYSRTKTQSQTRPSTTVKPRTKTNRTYTPNSRTRSQSRTRSTYSRPSNSKSSGTNRRVTPSRSTPPRSTARPSSRPSSSGSKSSGTRTRRPR